MSNPPKLCPTCRAPIPADAPAGLCPGCLLLGAAAPTEPAPGALASAPSMGQVVAAFPELEIVELFAHGGMGVIYKARQPRLDRLVALKILPPNLARQPGFTERFTREARALARLNHPHIVAVYDFGERAGLCFLIMEFVNGVNLRQAIRAGVTPEQALALVPPICEALQFAHDHGVLHRDIKPENILLDVRGTPKLADFGIAKLAEEKAESSLTMSGDALGTAAYMAPEQIEKPGTVDHRADIYSLGVVLYEMLTGELPLGRFAAPSSKAKVTTGVDDVVFRALEKERELRQQSATEMKTQVERATTAAAVPPEVSDDDWVLRCPACGHVSSIADVGIRIGAGSIGKRILARCPNCEYTGFTPLIQAKQARSERFIPDPGARERQGRAFAIAGALMNIAPIILFILAIWPVWHLADAWPNLEEGYGALRPDTRQMITALLLPAAVTASIAFGLTAVALWVSRYRAPWFFRWLISYGLITTPAIVGFFILGTCISRRREFFAEKEDPEIGMNSVHGRPTESPRGAGSSVLLVATVLCALLIPFAAANPTVGRLVSPTTLSILTAIFGALYGLWSSPLREDRLTSPAAVRPFPWKGVAILGAMTIPFAAILAIFAGPWTQHLGLSYALGVGAALLLPVCVALYGAGVAAAFRGLRTRAPRWVAGPAAIVLTLLFPAVLLWFSSFAPVGYQSIFQSPDAPSAYDQANAVTVIRPIAAPFEAKWAQGSLELIAVTRHGATNRRWWRMDGLRAFEGPFTNGGTVVNRAPGQEAYEFYFRARDLPPGSSGPHWLFGATGEYATGRIPALAAQPERMLPGYHIIAAAVSGDLERLNLKAGFAYEPWHTLSANRPNNVTSSGVWHEGVNWQITHGEAHATADGAVVVTISSEPHLSWEARVVAVTNDGTELPFSQVSRMGAQAEWRFDKLPLVSVRELRFQVRPIRWVDFRGIALRPVF